MRILGRGFVPVPGKTPSRRNRTIYRIAPTDEGTAKDLSQQLRRELGDRVVTIKNGEVIVDVGQLDRPKIVAKLKKSSRLLAALRLEGWL